MFFSMMSTFSFGVLYLCFGMSLFCFYCLCWTGSECHYSVSIVCVGQAMQEFAKLCQEKDANVISAVLPQWPKLFIRLSIVSIF